MSRIASAIVWIAVIGLCLRVLGVRWASWLLLPAAFLFVAWVVLQTNLDIPFWVLLVLAPLVPVFGLILAIRAAQAVLKGFFGDDAAAHVVGHWLISIFGAFGRGRRQRLSEPELPRSKAHPFDLHDVEREP